MKRATVYALLLVVGASLAAFGCKKKETAAVSVPPPPWK